MDTLRPPAIPTPATIEGRSATVVMITGDVVYFGKLSLNKGVHLLLEALAGVDVRTVVVGFGEDRVRLDASAPPRTRTAGGMHRLS